MSFFTYSVECEDCHKTATTAFGIVGMTLLASPLEKCPDCGGKMKQIEESIYGKTDSLDKLCIECSCSAHHLEVWYDNEIDELYLDVEVKARGFLSALKEAWKMFTRVRKGCYEEVILDKESQEKLYLFLKNVSNRRRYATSK